MIRMGSTDAQPGREAPAPVARPTPALAMRCAAAKPVTSHATPPGAPAPPATDVAPRPATASSGGAKLDFAAEYERAYRVLWTVAAGVLGSPGGAEDIVQEAACLALAKQDQFAPGTNFVAWMAQMVRFVGLNHVRKDARNRAIRIDQTDAATHVPRRPGMNSTGGSEAGLTLGRRGEMPADQRSFDDELMRALDGLTDVARACLLLRTLEGLDYTEIGRILEIPEGTAMSHVHRSRMRLREQLLKGQAWGNSIGKGQQP
jgi:RNA polymerase sigma-70 factor (ECF subfamily)